MSSTTTECPATRDCKGRFAAGNHGGPGNPHARQTAALRQALLDSVTAEDIAAIARALVAKAQKGDFPAAKLLLGHALGKPTPAVDPDRLDAAEWSNFQETSRLMLDLPKMIGAPDAALPLDLVRGTRPAMTRDRQQARRAARRRAAATAPPRPRDGGRAAVTKRCFRRSRVAVDPGRTHRPARRTVTKRQIAAPRPDEWPRFLMPRFGGEDESDRKKARARRERERPEGLLPPVAHAPGAPGPRVVSSSL